MKLDEWKQNIYVVWLKCHNDNYFCDHKENVNKKCKKCVFLPDCNLFPFEKKSMYEEFYRVKRGVSGK